MAEEWDVEDFDPDAGFKKADDRWEGEDEELDVLTTKTEQATATSTSGAESLEKKSKKERIEEKKAQRRAEEAAAKLLEEETQQSDTEVKLAQEELLQIQREKDLEVAKDLFGNIPQQPASQPTVIEAMNPITSEDFKVLEDALVKKLSTLETSPHFVRFLEDLMRRVGAPMDVEDLRRLSNTISLMAIEKQKAKQAKKPKKPKASLGGKAAKKADLTAGDFDDYGVGGVEGEADDFDFM